MTFYSIMESISHLGKMAQTSAKSENPNETSQFLANSSRKDHCGQTVARESRILD